MPLFNTSEARHVESTSITHQAGEKKESIQSPVDQILSRRSKEVVLAFCGPLGGGVSKVANEFIEYFKEYDYFTHYIKISKFIEELAPENGYKIDKNKLEEPGTRIEELQNAGNFLRKKFAVDILAQCAVKKISLTRQKDVRSKTSGDEPNDKLVKISNRVAYIVESLKHPSEVQLLRSVYGNMFYLIGVLCAKPIRHQRLKKNKEMADAKATSLMERDEAEGETHGQQLEKTLKYADFFIRNNHKNIECIKDTIKRDIELILGKPVITPTLHEYAMYIAQSAALRSACLSRQVGAAILSSNGEIIATGSNDVPMAGGGLYTVIENAKEDARCVKLEGSKCFNDEHKGRIKKQIQKILEEELKDVKKAEYISEKISKETRLKSLLEFSRSVHAEMDAIISAARKGNVPLKDSALYTTTFPCHSCARHIIAAGIKEVYYIEPFEKSLALDLHEDAIILEPSESKMLIKKVAFLHFEGVAPRQYMNLFFSYMDRKENGILTKTNIREAIPAIPEFMDSYMDYEAKVVEHLNKLQIDKSDKLKEENYG